MTLRIDTIAQQIVFDDLKTDQKIERAKVEATYISTTPYEHMRVTLYTFADESLLVERVGTTISLE